MLAGGLSAQTPTVAELPDAPQAQLAQNDSQLPAPQITPRASGGATASTSNGSIFGTVMDVNGDLVPKATISLDEAAGGSAAGGSHRVVVANENAWFEFDGLKAGVAYKLSANVKGFVNWSSPPIALTPEQHAFLENIQLTVAGEQTSVTVYASNEQLATEQLKIEEQQRVLGIIPNFYVVYDAANAAPLTTKLKFKLALRVSTDPITAVGVLFMAGVDQAARTPDYTLGAKGYGQRVGAVAGGGFSDILIGGAILPSLLHQDPRYFYQGTGTTKSRLKYALLNPFVCRGDNGQRQPNYSSMGGDLLATVIEETYYPSSDRNAGMVFQTFGINTAERMLSGLAQEFILPKLTHNAKKH